MTGLPPDFLVPRVLHRDGVMLVIDKPAGMPVHAGPGGGDNLERYFEALRFGLSHTPALAHRLDRDTTGCLILGRHPKALRKLGRLFSDGKIDKTYWALCRGAPDAEEGRITARLKKTTRADGWRVEIAEDGQEAATRWRVLASMRAETLIEAIPETGRTHQIRVHLAAIGLPIIGDPLYGALTDDDRRAPMMLHARRIVAPIAATKPPVDVVAPLPGPFRARLAAFPDGVMRPFLSDDK